MNPHLDRLQPYPFERLRALLADVVPPPGVPPLKLTIGEPQDAPPHFALQALWDARAGYGNYPATAGTPKLRAAVAAWLVRRFRLPAASLDPERHVLPLGGTREGLFAVAQALVGGPGAAVAMPNPGYQIYEGAAFLAGAEPIYLPCTPATGFQPDPSAVPDDVWDRVQLVYLCSPGNPTGAVLRLGDWRAWLERADRHDFVLAADECYSELYADEAAPPLGLLEACAALGRDDYRRCLVFHSLSKRSNLPGLRSGFVAGDAALLERFLRYRTYHGCAMPLPVQQASIAAWGDEDHVTANRRGLRAKFAAFAEVLGDVAPVAQPPGAFYLWLPVPGGDDQAFARRLLAEQHLFVLPGSFLGRAAGGPNPGTGFVRVSLVAPLADCREAAARLREVWAGG